MSLHIDFAERGTERSRRVPLATLAAFIYEKEPETHLKTNIEQENEDGSVALLFEKAKGLYAQNSGMNELVWNKLLQRDVLSLTDTRSLEGKPDEPLGMLIERLINMTGLKPASEEKAEHYLGRAFRAGLKNQK